MNPLIENILSAVVEACPSRFVPWTVRLHGKTILFCIVTSSCEGMVNTK